MKSPCMPFRVPSLAQGVVGIGIYLVTMLLVATSALSQVDLTDPILPHSADSQFPGDVAGWDYEPKNASDNMIGLDHCWHSCDDRQEIHFPHWIQIDLGSPHAVTQLNLLAYSEYSTGNVRLKDFWFEGSNDGIEYTPLQETACIYDNSHEWQTFMFHNTSSYRFYRVRGLSNWAPAGTLMASQMVIEEWEMLENPISVEEESWGCIKALYR